MPTKITGTTVTDFCPTLLHDRYSILLLWLLQQTNKLAPSQWLACTHILAVTSAGSARNGPQEEKERGGTKAMVLVL